MTDYSGAEKFILQKLESELPKNLSYHAINHTLDVLEAALRIAAGEGITDEEELKLLRVAVLIHDAGFILSIRGTKKKAVRWPVNFFHHSALMKNSSGLFLG